MNWALVAKAIYVRSSLVLLVFSGIAGFFVKPSFVTGILLGGVLLLGNFYVMQDNIVRLFGSQKGMKGAKGSIIGKFYLRLMLLGLLIYLLLKLGIEPLALAIGFSSLIIGIVSLAVISIKETKEAV